MLFIRCTFIYMKNSFDADDVYQRSLVKNTTKVPEPHFEITSMIRTVCGSYD